MTLTPDLLARLALKAGAEIDRIYTSDFTTTRKADASPVTEADSAAETIILDGLAYADPGLVVIAEESVSRGDADLKTIARATRFALVDPLDGTKEFVNRNGEFTVNIAIIEHGRPVMGVVYAPALKRLFVADRREAWQARVAPGEPLPEHRQTLRIRRAPANGLTVFASKSHRTPETDAWLARYRIADLRAAGSSLKFCLIAAGEADLYPRLGDTCLWDIAAGHAVLEAAGGRVLKLDGAPVTYAPNAPGFLSPHFVAYGDVSPAG